MSLPKLTSISTQTLSLLLERQRLQAISALASSDAAAAATTGGTAHLDQIVRNLRQLHDGILDLERQAGDAASVPAETLPLLASQYERMRHMLGSAADAHGVPSLGSSERQQRIPTAGAVPPPRVVGVDEPPESEPPHPVYSPYTDDPEAGYEPGAMLQTQHQLMDEQDTHLEGLSHSINRQRDISLQINDELGVHTGLLEELDTDIDVTHGRLSGARRRLDRVANGAKENGSALTIALLILVLLILIVAFKT